MLFEFNNTINSVLWFDFQENEFEGSHSSVLANDELNEGPCLPTTFSDYLRQVRVWLKKGIFHN